MLTAGTDEVGCGPLAGPVTGAAVVFPEGYCNPEIRDSKQLSAKKRELLCEVIRRDALAWAIVSVGHHRIDAINIREAARLAKSLAVKRVQERCGIGMVLVDGNVPIHTSLPQKTVIGGDRIHVEISAASILAKVHRDALMVVLDEKYPGYGFKKHAGYPTPQHKAAIAKLGPSRVHRRTFSGVSEFCTDSIKSGATELSQGCESAYLAKPHQAVLPGSAHQRRPDR